MDKKTTDIVAYLTWIGLIIAFVAGDKENCKFHLNQSLVIVILELLSGVIAVVLGFIPFVGPILASVVGIAIFVLWILGLVSAIQGQEKPLPIIGGIKILK